MSEAAAELPRWAEAALAASLFAVDPVGAGVSVRAHAGPVRDAWLVLMRALVPAAMRVRRVRVRVSDDRLLGGLDLSATLQAGRPVAERGLLAEADGGVVVLAMAERLAPAAAARLSAVLDSGEVVLERDGLALRMPSRFGVIALDEGLDDERPPGALLDRLAFHLDLDGLSGRETFGAFHTGEEIVAARARLASVTVGDEVLQALCATAMALGVISLRGPLLAVRAACAAAALSGRDAVTADDAALAARLVLAPRATQIPVVEQPPSEDAAPTEPEQGADAPDTPPPPEEEEESAGDGADRPLADRILEAAQAAIPAGLLAQLQLMAGKPRGGSAGRAGAVQRSMTRGRPTGARRGELRPGVRLNVVETLRAAAPWQGLRRRALGTVLKVGERPARVEIRPDDFHITQYKQRAETTTIFVVDASGSAALNRLAEAKGAVELLLADCYVRRDQVALVSFRGKAADLLLPPTRSLVRAKRSLASLPGGGGTPLAAGIDTAGTVADAVRRRGATPTIVLLTDGRGNVARDGTPGRAQAEADTLLAARMIRAAGFTTLLVDTSPRPQANAQRLAVEMGARYLALPYADASMLSRAVRAAA